MQIHFFSKYLAWAALALAVPAVPGCEKAAEQTIVSQAGEQRDAGLPNGAAVVLNAQSSLAFSASTWGVSPVAMLDGEAFFKNKNKKRFTVKARQGQVEAIEGNFNVYARGDLMEVQCVQGKLQVLNPDGTEKVLIATSEQVSIENGRMQKRRGLSYSPAWFNGQSVFRDAPLGRVLGEIGRQYGVVVEADSVSGDFSGKFDHKNLEKALAAVCGKAGLKYEVSGDTVRVGR